MPPFDKKKINETYDYEVIQTFNNEIALINYYQTYNNNVINLIIILIIYPLLGLFLLRKNILWLIIVLAILIYLLKK